MSPVDIERLARVESVLRVRRRASRRGSWFVVSAKTLRSFPRGYALPNVFNDPNAHFSDEVFEALDVVCMHCSTQHSWTETFERNSKFGYAHICLTCDQPLWLDPNVLVAATVVLRSTGDFALFNQTLMYPPAER